MIFRTDAEKAAFEAGYKAGQASRPEVAFSESDLLRAMDIVRTWGDSTTNAGCLEILKRNPPQNGKGTE